MSKNTVRGRIAPSPTGRIHLGNAFAFLMAFCSVKSKRGSLVLRIEDIDPDRSRPEFEQGIIEDLAWLGISYDEGPLLHGSVAPYKQSERKNLYESAIHTLGNKGLTYSCFCTRKELKALASAPHNEDRSVYYPGTCRNLSESEQKSLIASGKKACVRLNVEKSLKLCSSRTMESILSSFLSETSSFSDASLTCGGDFALMRSDGVFAYQLAVVVDDITMNITEVIRGNDLEESTPRQKLLYHLLGAESPSFYHFPLLYDHYGDRLAKRHNSLTITSLREQGIKPEVVTGYLAFLSGLIETNIPMQPMEIVKYWNKDTIKRGAIILPQDPIKEFCL